MQPRVYVLRQAVKMWRPRKGVPYPIAVGVAHFFVRTAPGQHMERSLCGMVDTRGSSLGGPWWELRPRDPEDDRVCWHCWNNARRRAGIRINVTKRPSPRPHTL